MNKIVYQKLNGLNGNDKVWILAFLTNELLNKICVIEEFTLSTRRRKIKQRIKQVFKACDQLLNNNNSSIDKNRKGCKTCVLIGKMSYEAQMELFVKIHREIWQ